MGYAKEKKRKEEKILNYLLTSSKKIFLNKEIIGSNVKISNIACLYQNKESFY